MLKYFYYKETILAFSSCDGEIKAFNRSFEAIDFAFARTSYQLQKIIFHNIQKMVMPKDTSLQSWRDVGMLLCFSSTRVILYHLQFVCVHLLQQKLNFCRNLYINRIVLLIFVSGCFCFKQGIKRQKILGINICRGLRFRIFWRYYRRVTTLTSHLDNYAF